MRINELKAITDITKWITGLYNDKIDHISANITDSTHVKVIFERNIIEDNEVPYKHEILFDFSNYDLSSYELNEVASSISHIVFRPAYFDNHNLFLKEEYNKATENNIKKHPIPFVEIFEPWMKEKFPDKPIYEISTGELILCSDLYMKEDKNLEFIENNKNVEEVVSATIQYIDKNIKAGKLITEMDEIVIQSANAYLRKLLADIRCK